MAEALLPRLLRAALLPLLLALPAAFAEEPDGQVRVELSGLDGELEDNARAYLSIARYDDEPSPGRARLRWLHEQAEEELRRALEPFGYYRVEVTAELEERGDEWIARYRVTPGDPIVLSRVDIEVLGEGADDAAFTKLVAEREGLTPGETLDHRHYGRLKGAMQGLAMERGYFDADFRAARIEIDLQRYQAGVELHYDTGQRYRFGETLFDDSPLRNELLVRFPSFRRGDPFSVRALLDLQRGLIDTNYFDSVQVEPHRELAQGLEVPVHAHLSSNTRNRYLLGLGYGTDTGARGRIGIERRLLNSRGHRYQAELLASQIKSSLTAEYSIPGALPRTDRYLLRGGVTTEDSSVKDADTAVLGISHQRQIGSWRRTLSLDYQYERFRLGTVEEESTLLIPGISLTRTRADNRLFAREGSQLSLDLRGAYTGLLSDTSFVQAGVSGKWIHSLTERSRLIARGEISGSWVSSFGELPASLRRFAGGDRSVRGYALDSIAPTDASGTVIGGRNLIVGSLEYDYQFLDDWGVAVFVDVGDAFDDASARPHTGVGVGLRWNSPVGPVRVDVASGLDDPGDRVRLHLTIGPDF